MVLKDFGIEYSKSGRAICRACEIKIVKEDIRIRKTVYDTGVGMKDGRQPLWHHADCFVKVRDELGFFSSGEVLPGFKDLTADDKKKVKDLLKAVKATDIPEAKKIKLEKKEDAEEAKENDLYKSQNEQFYKYKGKLEANLKNHDLSEMLTYNKQLVPQGKERVRGNDKTNEYIFNAYFDHSLL